jgi:hypothetical protein
MGEGRKTLRCRYSTVLGPADGTDRAYASVSSIAVGVAGGVNGCVFAYGQTGAGKTHTMLGDERNSYDGVTGRCVDGLFSELNQMAETRSDSATSQSYSSVSYSVHCSFLQIYNEK